MCTMLSHPTESYNKVSESLYISNALLQVNDETDAVLNESLPVAIN